ncbi:37055_t:CDS:2 [Gigaspora margarita]|uniref:37055_t:CDS:1 n=1 Tax=Gigaspora margarita TaxID=4874 RepID=A0ABN7WJ41_GIGMA|nr:37055_t:CDS:2 [Gigaspora margarita]
MEQTYSDTSAGNKIGIHEFLEALGLLDNEVVPVNMDDDNNSESDIDKEDNALKKLYQAREAHQCFILLRLFTICLPNLSEQAKNGLFVAFSKSNLFEALEHNALLDALAYPVKGLNLFEYNKLSTDLEHVSLMCYLVDEAT